MSEPFIAEIRIFAGNFAPRGWAFCDGQLVSIDSNQALFSILGTTYGGDGRQNFLLPNLIDRFPVHASPSWPLGAPRGDASVTLSTSQIPDHSHDLTASGDAGTTGTPDGSVTFAATGDGSRVYGDGSDPVPLPDAIAPAGGGQAHENRQPFLGVNFIIALQGTFPTRG